MSRANHHVHFFPGLTIALMAAACLSGALAGCASHQPPPQQRFINALMQGNGPRADYIWNNMSVTDRMSFSRGEGLSPQIDPDALAAQIERHQAEQNGEGAGDDAPATVYLPPDDSATQE